MTSSRRFCGIILLAFALAPAWGQVLPSPFASDCFANNVNAALARIRAADQEIETALQDIAGKNVKCYVVEQYTDRAETLNHDSTPSSPFSIEISAPGYRFADDPTGGRWEDGSCNTFDTTLAHEIYHCWSRATNFGKEFPEWEKKAVQFENRYRSSIGICKRTVYSGTVVDTTDCTASEPSCPVTANSCEELFCCWVYGGIKMPLATGGYAWSACWIPNVTIAFCMTQTVEGQSSAGAYDKNACKQPDPNTPYCGGSGGN